MTRLILFMALLGFSGFAGATPHTQVSVSYDAEAFDAYLAAQQGADLDATKRGTCHSRYKKGRRTCKHKWKNNEDKQKKCLSKNFKKYKRCAQRCKSKFDRKIARCERKKKNRVKKCKDRAVHWYRNKCLGKL